MDHRTRTLAVLNYEEYDRMPVVHFGYWTELLEKWAAQGHISELEARGWSDGNLVDESINQRLGFDANWDVKLNWNAYLDPPLVKQIIEERPDGSQLVLNEDGVYVIEKPGIVSIPPEVDHLLKGREEWEEIFKPRLQWDVERLNRARVTLKGERLAFGDGGSELLKGERGVCYGLWAGSLLGIIRNWVGLMALCRMMVRKEPLLDEIIERVADLAYQGVAAALESGARFDFAHFWEDIAFRSGPLVNPRFFAEKIGPHYKRITDLLHSYGVDIISVDCDGKIDALIPIWLENGVNTMFPIEVGAWDASLQPWREKYGRQVRGVGGVRKAIFGMDYAAIDAEIERLRPLVDLGGYIPCPDHRLPIDARWENVQYYCERMHRLY